jgi:hypothetical protein
MKDQDWDLIYQVHLNGTYKCTKAAWEHMRNQKYGRIINVTSAAGLYGNFGQANYSAMKLAIVGLSNTLAIEGKSSNIKCNVIAPIAGSRMTETIMPADLVAALKPEFVTPLVAYLAHDSIESTGGIYEIGAGWISKVRWQRTKGHFFDTKAMTPEAVRDSWSKVTDWTSPTNPTSAGDTITMLVAHLQGQGKSEAAPAATKPAGKSESVDVAAAMAHKFQPTKSTYTDKDAMLYALGVGVRPDPAKADDLLFVYENHPNFRVLPTMGVTFPFEIMAQVRFFWCPNDTVT